MAPDAGSFGKVEVFGARRRREGAKCAEFEGRGVVPLQIFGTVG